jgi:SNF2 family DNA or RNA helicase
MQRVSSIKELTRADLRRYQRWLETKIVVMREIYIALDMGLGKTAIVLHAIKRMLCVKVARVLIIGPLKVIEQTWPDEIERWQSLRGLDYSVISGTPKERLAAMHSKARIHLINKENVPWLWRQLKKKWPYDMVVWDEASALKSWKKKTANHTLTRFGAIAKARPFIERMVMLCGTPTPKGVIDLGGQMFILDQGVSLGTDRVAFQERWFTSDYMGYNIEPKDHAFDEIMDRCEDIMLSLHAEDYIDLPPSKIVPLYVDLPKSAMAEYRRFEKTLVSETYDVEAVSSGVLAGKLLQFASGSMYRQPEGQKHRDVVKIHDAKIEALERIVEEENGHNMLVAYGHRFDIDLIKKKYPKAVLEADDKDFIKNWNAGKIGMGLVHPASIGHGTNLQFGGHIGVWFGLTWSLELWQQFNKRLPRPGQEAKMCFYYVIMARGTIDEDCYETMEERGATQAMVHERIARTIRDEEG